MRFAKYVIAFLEVLGAATSLIIGRSWAATCSSQTI